MIRAPLSVFLLRGACTSGVVPLPPKETATQELIVSSSEQKAVDSLKPFAAPSAYVDSSEFTGSKYELAAFKAWLLEHGAALAAARRH